MRIAFLTYFAETFNQFESLYLTLCGDDRFDPILVAYPKPTKCTTNTSIAELYEKKHYPYIAGSDFNKSVSSKDFDFSFVFFSTPYGAFHQNLNIDLLSKKSILCLLNYGYTIFSNDYLNCLIDPWFYARGHYVFVENDLNRQAIESKKVVSQNKSLKILTVGSTKLVRPTSFIESPWKFRDSFKIIYTPRWNQRDGTCTYNLMAPALVNFCKLHPEVEVIVRFHLMHDYDKSLILKASRTLCNISIHNQSEYDVLFERSNVLISDASTLISEYFVFNKPVIYTWKKNVFNAFGQALLSGMYVVSTKKTLEGQLVSLLHKNDPLKPERERLIEKFYNYDPIGNIVHLLGKNYK